jgi:hypothetical protein
MTLEQFDALTEQLHKERKLIIQAKRPEYTEGNADVLANFKLVARELNITPIQVWYVYFRKHVASISQFAARPNMQLSEPPKSRICDAINYLELLFALIEENENL